MLGSPCTFELEPYPWGAKSVDTTQQGSDRFSLLYSSGLEPNSDLYISIFYLLNCLSKWGIANYSH